MTRSPRRIPAPSVVLRATSLALILAALVTAGRASQSSSIAGGISADSLARFRTNPNVLLVSIDSLRADHVHAYGYPRQTTPTLDWLAKEGVLFAQAVAPAPWTLPSHMTLLTSKPPREHGVRTPQVHLATEVMTLARAFQHNGYATAGFASGPFLAAKFGFPQGFDHYDDRSIPQVSPFLAARGSTSPRMVGLVRRWIDGWRREGATRPFFLFVHLWDVHYDYDPPPPYDRLFDPDYRGQINGRNFMDNPRVSPTMDPRDLAHVVALYDGEIRYTDHYLDRLLNYLRRLHVLDDTVVLVTADHGDEFFEHGRKGHAVSLYDEMLRVPFVIRYPRRVPAGQRVQSQVRLADVGATALGLAGISPPEGFGSDRRGEAVDHERDLTPWITRRGPLADMAPLPAFSESTIMGLDKTAVRTGREKLIEDLRGVAPTELYDLAVDPGEKANVAGTDSDRVKDLSRLRTTWLASFTGSPPVADLTLDEKTKESLRALGYLGD